MFCRNEAQTNERHARIQKIPSAGGLDNFFSHQTYSSHRGGRADQPRRESVPLRPTIATCDFPGVGEGSGPPVPRLYPTSSGSAYELQMKMLDVNISVGFKTT